MSLLFHPGDVFYELEDREYYLYKVLRKANEDRIYVSSYWPSAEQPTSSNRRTFDLRTTCESAETVQFKNPVFVCNEPVTAAEEEEYSVFRRIEEGKQNRANHFAELLQQADDLLANRQFEEALALYTECASFSKYYFPIFDKRGYCLLQLERYSESIADLEHSLSIFPEGKDSLLHCASAYYRWKNYPKAIEKLETLLLLDPHKTDAQHLLRTIQEEAG